MAPHLTDMQRAMVISKLESGFSMGVVAQQMNVSKNCIFKIKKKYEQHQTVQRLPGSGPSRVSTAEDDERLINYLKENPFSNVVEAARSIHFPGSK